MVIHLCRHVVIPFKTETFDEYHQPNKSAYILKEQEKTHSLSVWFSWKLFVGLNPSTTIFFVSGELYCAKLNINTNSLMNSKTDKISTHWIFNGGSKVSIVK